MNNLNKKFINVSRPDLSQLESKYLNEALNSTWISSKGKYIEKVENILPKFAGKKYALVTSNGTTALHLALRSLEIKKGDEIIVPSFTFVATVNAIIYCGGVPRFIDINKDHWCIDENKITKLINKKTKGILIPHIYGYPLDISNILKIAKKHKLWIVEDIAESLFGEHKKGKSGSQGIIATCSFFGNKIITSGEGGAVLTSNKFLLEKMKQMRNQGMNAKKRYWHDVVGFNYRMTNLQAAILFAQLQRIDEILESRIKLYKMYDEILSEFDFVKIQVKPNGGFIAPWSYPVMLTSKIKFKNMIIKQLEKEGIETRPFFIPIHLMPPYRVYVKKSDFLINTRIVSRGGFNLPTASNFTKFETKYIKNSLIRILKGISD